jgi:hypothetical protein
VSSILVLSDGGRKEESAAPLTAKVPAGTARDVKTVAEFASKGIGNAEFGTLLQLILDAEERSTS